MPTALQLLVREFLARPEIVEARSRAALEARHERRRSATDKTLEPTDNDALSAEEERALDKALTRLMSVRHGSWRAEDVEPYLASPRSSLNMMRIPNYVEAREHVLDEMESTAVIVGEEEL
jgi:hypothetical protein